MRISIITAFDLNRGIGYKGLMPWALSDDLRRFKDLTLGHHLLMGRKTWESIGGPLAGRVGMVLSTQDKPLFDGVVMVKFIHEAIAFARTRGENEFFIAGGGEVYQSALAFAERLYITRIEAETKADTFFPDVDYSQWNLVQSLSFSVDDRNQYATDFCIYDRL